MRRIFDKMKQYRWLMVILLNITVVGILLIIFQPIRNQDDYAIASDLYGSYLGRYNNSAIYINPVYATLVTWLLTLNGSVPWYPVLMYIWTFIALTLVTFCLIDLQDNWFGWGAGFVLAFAFGYECYICLQWTKISAIALAAGFFYFMCREKMGIGHIVAFIEILAGALIRSSNIPMVLGVWGCTLVFEIFLQIIDKKSVVKYIKKIFVLLCVGVAIWGVTKYTSSMSVDDTDYPEWNANRAYLQDYGIPDYMEYKEIYETYGITQDEWKYVRAWGTDVYNAELYENLVTAKKEILKYKSGKTEELGILVRKFMVQYPRNFVQIDVFYCYLVLLILLLVLLKTKFRWLMVGYSFVMLMGLNFYLFYKGRYFIHRVDVGIFFAVILALLYLWRKGVYSPPKTSRLWTAIVWVGVLIILTPIGVMDDDVDFIPITMLQENKMFNHYSSKDDHFYVYANTNYHNNWRIASFDVFQVPELGELKNTFGILFPTKMIQQNLKKQGITDPYVDLVDGTGMYFVSDRSEVDEWMIGYLAKRNGKPVTVTMVKKVLNKYIYRVNSGDISELYQFDDIKEDNTHLVNTTENTIKDRVLNIRGNLYMDNENDFYQNVYIRIKDGDTGETNLFYVCQNQDKKFKVGTPGWCSALDVAIPLPDTYDEKDEISFVIEAEDGVYQCGINIAH